MEHLAVYPNPHFINDSGLEIYKNYTRNVLSSTSLAEERVESIVTSINGLIIGHLTISLKQNHTIMRELEVVNQSQRRHKVRVQTAREGKRKVTHFCRLSSRGSFKQRCRRQDGETRIETQAKAGPTRDASKEILELPKAQGSSSSRDARGDKGPAEDSDTRDREKTSFVVEEERGKNREGERNPNLVMHFYSTHPLPISENANDNIVKI
ncbi:hypothetical protein RJT34_08073 [Clitoria ternatea]|uniref:Uncharacterized protein n=1 Tax=Clitoria ternatea TaxID=43366 RepID=A0AAN9PUM3_CLITE